MRSLSPGPICVTGKRSRTLLLTFTSVTLVSTSEAPGFYHVHELDQGLAEDGSQAKPTFLLFYKYSFTATEPRSFIYVSSTLLSLYHVPRDLMTLRFAKLQILAVWPLCPSRSSGASGTPTLGRGCELGFPPADGSSLVLTRSRRGQLHGCTRAEDRLLARAGAPSGARRTAPLPGCTRRLAWGPIAPQPPQTSFAMPPGHATPAPQAASPPGPESHLCSPSPSLSAELVPQTSLLWSQPSQPARNCFLQLLPLGYQG